MTRMRDITGQTFGTLTAIAPTSKRSGTNIIWRCICSCDRDTCPKEVFIACTHLTRNETKSCRCQQLIHPAIRTYFEQITASARKRNYLFTLTFKQFHTLIKQACAYCGDTNDIKQMYKNNKAWRLRANGIDRKDNTLGYTIDNCVACCQWCNRAKDILSQQEYIKHCKKVAAFNVNQTS